MGTRLGVVAYWAQWVFGQPTRGALLTRCAAYFFVANTCVTAYQIYQVPRSMIYQYGKDNGIEPNRWQYFTDRDRADVDDWVLYGGLAAVTIATFTGRRTLACSSWERYLGAYSLGSLYGWVSYMKFTDPGGLMNPSRDVNMEWRCFEEDGITGLWYSRGKPKKQPTLDE